MTAKSYDIISSGNKLIILSFLLGFTSIVSQILILREFLLIFHGNELVIGFILATWMIATGLGAYLARFCKPDFIKNSIIKAGFYFLGVLPAIVIFLINYLRYRLFHPGIEPGLTEISLFSVIVLLPFCLISGFIFVMVSSVFSSVNEENRIDKIYGFESLGSVAGGLMFTFIFSEKITTFQCAAIIFIANFLTVSFLSEKKLFLRILFLIISGLIFSISFLLKIDLITKQNLFGKQKLIHTKDTPFGNISVVKTGKDLTFFDNGVLLASSPDIVRKEEAVHFAMVQNDNPGNVLLISGGLSGMLDEILKYPVKSIDYVELNPEIINMGFKYSILLKNKKITYADIDPGIFIKKTRKIYDIVIMNLPEPTTAQINRYYTVEFYNELKRKISGDGLISFGISSTLNYVSKEAGEVNSSIFNTLKVCFRNVSIIPGDKIYFLASEKKIKSDVINLLQQKGIENEIVNQYYYNDTLIKERAEYIKSLINNKTKINSDFFPKAYFSNIKFWLSKNDNSRTYYLHFLILSFIILTILIFINKNVVGLGMFGTGYMGSAAEFVLILTFQITSGYVYKTIGIIFAIYMTGLAAGSFIRKKIMPKPVIKDFFKFQIKLILAILLCIPVIVLIKFTDSTILLNSILFLLLFLISGITGVCFSIATALADSNIMNNAAKIYSADLLGSAAGAFLTSVFIIPVAGIYNTILITALTGLLTLIILVGKRKFTLT